MAPRTDFPPVRACLFDMDGLLLDTEDLYTLCINLILEKYGRPKMPWHIKAKLQGRPGPTATRLFHDWAQLPIDYPTYTSEYYALQARHFPGTQPMPGIPELLSDLGRTRVYDGVVPSSTATQRAGHAPPAHRVHIALATSAHESNFKLKTSHLSELFSVFETHRRVLGDDARIPPGRGKPLPDIYLIALKTINDSLPATEPPIRPEECLVFEDSVPGVEAGRRAGFRVVWCPHPLIKKHYAGREAEVLAGRTGEAGHVDMHQVGELDDGWAEYMPTLVGFPFEKYGIRIPDKAEVEKGAVKMGEAVHVGKPKKDGAAVSEEEIVELVKPGPKLKAAPVA